MHVEIVNALKALTHFRLNVGSAAASLCLGLLFALSQPICAASRAETQALNLRRAEDTYAAMNKAMLDERTGLNLEHPRGKGNGALADEWPFSQAHIAALDLAGISDLNRAHRLAALNRARKAQELYWMEASATGKPGYSSKPAGVGQIPGALYYDDNEWVGLAAIQHWLFFKDKRSLNKANAIFALIERGWDEDPLHPARCGIFWTQDPNNRDRNTVSNMPAAQLGVRLFMITKDRRYLTAALRYYDWAIRNMQTANGLFYDHIDLNGQIDKTVWTYNQGVPAGVNVLLYKATGEKKYIIEAKRIAEASYKHFIASGSLKTQPPPFNAIYFKNLLLLERVVGGTRYRDAMQHYADWMWNNCRDQRTGLFFEPRRPSSAPNVITQGAMAQVFAVLAWNSQDWDFLY